MVKLGDVCTINPKSPGFQDKLTVSFVPMPKIGENGEFDPSEIKTYQEVKKGFTYFQNGDVLFAKITPCMENGKGAIAQSLENGVGFGSTEFYVLRPLSEYVTSKWLFYLLSWEAFRKNDRYARQSLSPDFSPQTAAFQIGRVGQGAVCGDVWGLLNQSQGLENAMS